MMRRAPLLDGLTDQRRLVELETAGNCLTSSILAEGAKAIADALVVSMSIDFSPYSKLESHESPLLSGSIGTANISSYNFVSQQVDYTSFLSGRNCPSCAKSIDPSKRLCNQCPSCLYTSCEDHFGNVEAFHCDFCANEKGLVGPSRHTKNKIATERNTVVVQDNVHKKKKKKNKVKKQGEKKKVIQPRNIQQAASFILAPSALPCEKEEQENLDEKKMEPQCLRLSTQEISRLECITHYSPIVKSGVKLDHSQPIDVERYGDLYFSRKFGDYYLPQLLALPLIVPLNK